MKVAALFVVVWLQKTITHNVHNHLELFQAQHAFNRDEVDQCFLVRKLKFVSLP